MVELQIHTQVVKRHGYLFPGVVVAVFEKLDGKKHYVVECTAKEALGILRIFNGEQLCVVGEPS